MRKSEVLRIVWIKSISELLWEPEVDKERIKSLAHLSDEKIDAMILEREKRQHIAEVKANLILNHGLYEAKVDALIKRYNLRKLPNGFYENFHDDPSAISNDMKLRGWM